MLNKLLDTCIFIKRVGDLIEFIKMIFGITVMLNLAIISETYGHGVLFVYYLISLIDRVNSTLGFCIGLFYTSTVIYTVYIKLKNVKHIINN